MKCYEVNVKVTLRYEYPLDNLDYRDPAHEGREAIEDVDARLYVWADSEGDALALAERFDFDTARLDDEIVGTDIVGISLFEEDDRVTERDIELDYIENRSQW